MRKRSSLASWHGLRLYFSDLAQGNTRAVLTSNLLTMGTRSHLLGARAVQTGKKQCYSGRGRVSAEVMRRRTLDRPAIFGQRDVKLSQKSASRKPSLISPKPVSRQFLLTGSTQRFARHRLHALPPLHFYGCNSPDEGIPQKFPCRHRGTNLVADYRSTLSEDFIGNSSVSKQRRNV
jgi:hypothetical protein